TPEAGNNPPVDGDRRPLPQVGEAVRDPVREGEGEDGNPDEGQDEGEHRRASGTEQPEKGGEGADPGVAAEPGPPEAQVGLVGEPAAGTGPGQQDEEHRPEQ